MPEQTQDTERLRKAAEALGEFFDSVQIIATRQADVGGWAHVAWGAGNYYARLGSVRAWVLVEEKRLDEPGDTEDE